LRDEAIAAGDFYWVDLKFDENEAENSEKRHFYGIIFSLIQLKVFLLILF